MPVRHQRKIEPNGAALQHAKKWIEREDRLRRIILNPSIQNERFQFLMRGGEDRSD